MKVKICITDIAAVVTIKYNLYHKALGHSSDGILKNYLPITDHVTPEMPNTVSETVASPENHTDTHIGLLTKAEGSLLQ